MAGTLLAPADLAAAATGGQIRRNERAETSCTGTLWRPIDTIPISGL
jgi:hypothetical protein